MRRNYIDLFPYDLKACLPIVERHEHTFRLTYSYSHFILCDSENQDWDYDWSETNYAQYSLLGYSRTPNLLHIAMPFQWGEAEIAIQTLDSLCWPVWLGTFERIYALPLAIPSGKILIQSPPDDMVDRTCTVEPGNYLVVVAHRQQTRYKDYSDVAVLLSKLEDPLARGEVLKIESQP